MALTLGMGLRVRFNMTRSISQWRIAAHSAGFKRRPLTPIMGLRLMLAVPIRLLVISSVIDHRSVPIFWKVNRFIDRPLLDGLCC
jgi:hypothetical protein